MSTANANRPHQRWTRQLLRGSALLPRPSTLKLFSLPAASGASFRLALGPHPPPTTKSCFIGIGRGGVIAREIVASRVQAPPAFCTEAKVAKGGAYLRDTTVLLCIHEHYRCYRKFDRSEILLLRSYFLGNFITERYFFLGNIIAARKFDRSRCHESERLLWSMTTLSLTPRSQSPVGELPWNQ